MNAVVSDWKINGFVMQFGRAIDVIAPQAVCARSVTVSGLTRFRASRRTGHESGVSPSPTRFLNAAAFTTSAGFNFGNLNNNLSWVRGCGQDENLTVGRVFESEQVKFDLA